MTIQNSDNDLRVIARDLLQRGARQSAQDLQNAYQVWDLTDEDARKVLDYARGATIILPTEHQ